jgi:hypothetical protein
MDEILPARVAILGKAFQYETRRGAVLSQIGF